MALKHDFPFDPTYGYDFQTLLSVAAPAASRETYIHRGCVADYWGAASALIEVVPEAAGQLYYSGGIFGDGIGALMLPWDDRFAKAFLDVPSFGNHPLRLLAPCVGSGKSMRHITNRIPRWRRCCDISTRPARHGISRFR